MVTDKNSHFEFVIFLLQIIYTEVNLIVLSNFILIVICSDF